MSHRQFKLYNGLGQYQDLNNEEIFALAPSGFGYSKSLELLRIGDDMSIIDSTINLDTKELEIVLNASSNAYKYLHYYNLVKFLSFKPIYLLYQRPNDENWYRQEVEVVSLTKGEVSSEDSMMHLKLTMQALSFWEDDVEKVIKTSNTVDDGKVYPITYPIRYSVNTLSNIQMNSLSMLDTPLKITINGRCTNPVISIFDSNDVAYGKCKFIGTFDKVYINSNDKEEDVELTYNGALVDNPLGYQDLSIGNPATEYITFLKLKTGESKLQFIANLGFTGDIEVRWRNRYVSI